jgi:LysM repeat protein
MKKYLAIFMSIALLTACGQNPAMHADAPTIDKHENFMQQIKAQMRPAGPRILAVGEIRLVLDNAPLTLDPPPMLLNGATYIPLRALSTYLGAGVWFNPDSQTIGINQGDNRIAFVAGSTTAVVNGARVTIPPSTSVNGVTYVPIRFIAAAFGYQVLWDDGTKTVTIHTKPVVQQGVTVSYISHSVQSGETMWAISVKYGIPMLELLKLNDLSLSSSLTIGQKLKIPVYTVPVKATVGPQFGELLDWWTEARYVFPIGSEAVMTDVVTGRTFRVKHTMGGNHADAEPMTVSDAQMMKGIWGGAYSWTPRAVIVSVKGRRLAAAMHSYPHDGESIAGNDYNGHFCIHFLNSTRHMDGLVQASMQTKVKAAAGVQ